MDCGFQFSFLYFLICFNFLIISILYFYGQKKHDNKSYIYFQGCVNHTRSLSIDVISPLWNCCIPQLHCWNFSFVHAYLPPRFPPRSHPPASPTVLAQCPYIGGLKAHVMGSDVYTTMRMKLLLASLTDLVSQELPSL